MIMYKAITGCLPVNLQRTFDMSLKRIHCRGGGGGGLPAIVELLDRLPKKLISFHLLNVVDVWVPL